MAAVSTPPIIFDSDDFDSRSRFEAYRQLYAAGSTVEPTSSDFHACVEAQFLGSLVMFERRLHGISHERSLQRVRSDGFEHFTVQLNLSGGLFAEAHGDVREVPPGSIILFDQTQPQRTWLEQAHILTFSVVRDLVEAANPGGISLHGQVLSGPQAGLLADLMTSLVRRRIASDPKSVPGAVQIFRQTLILALNRDHPPLPEEAAEAIQRVKVLIEHHLAHPELSPAWLASMAGLSRTRLYEVFKPVGGISRYIQQRRASRLRVLLKQPEMRHLSVGALSLQAGFVSESHASRTFSDHFGVSPGQYRRAAAQDHSPPLPSPSPNFVDWIRTLK